MKSKTFRNVVWGIVGIVVLIFLFSMVQKSVHVGSKPENAIDKILARQAEAWEQHDFSIAAGDWAADGVLISPGGQFHVNELQSIITDYGKHFKDLHVKVTNTFVSADSGQAAVEWDWDVTRVRDGKRGVTHDAILITFQGDKIKSWREFFDLGDSVDAQP